MTTASELKRCFRTPIPEVLDAARYLDAAVSAHLSGHHDVAVQLFVLADDRKVWCWTDSIWGKKSPYVRVTRLPATADAAPLQEQRMPSSTQIAALIQRDGHHCRFCGLPVIRAEVRRKIVKAYPEVVRWQKGNMNQHAAFQALWAQYDHVVPFARGGTNELDNLVVTCAACNYGKMSYSCEELGLFDPRLYPPVQSTWDGLERFAVTA